MSEAAEELGGAMASKWMDSIVSEGIDSDAIDLDGIAARTVDA